MSLINDPSGTSSGYPHNLAGTASGGGELLAPPLPREEKTYRVRESKTAFLTTEFYAYLGTVAAIVIAALYFNGDGPEPDEFTADRALLYISWVTIGYMIARGLAKAGRPHGGNSSDR